MAEQQSASATTSKVQEVAANMQELASKRKRISPGKAETVARRYFEAIDARDIDAAVSLWAEGGRENVRGQLDVLAPDGVREFVSQMLGAFPDLRMRVVSTTAQDERCAVHWQLSGTFAGPASFAGVSPTGSVVELEGCDLLTVRDGLIHNNDAFADGMSFAREIGMMPPKDSSAEQRMTAAFNAKTRITGRLLRSEAELVAQGVWVVQGQPGRCNVYLIEDDGEVTLFDAGARTMTRSVASAAARLGGIKPDRARQRPHRPSRQRSGARGAGLLPSQRGRGRRRQRRLSLLAGGTRRPAGRDAPAAPPPSPLRLRRRAGEDRRHPPGG